VTRQKARPARPNAVPAYSKDEMKRLLEAVLFAADKPVPASTLVQVLSGAREETVREALSELRREYEETGRSFILKEVGGGFLLLTHPAYEPWVRKLFRGRLTLRLSKSALETVAIIAYRQPISKAEIETIRGVNADGVLNTLLDRKLIRVVGRKPGMGRALLYGTTGDFLTYMGLNDLSELPQLDEMKAILESREPSPAAPGNEGQASLANQEGAPAPETPEEISNET
jgi:segregation and condensation protein B